MKRLSLFRVLVPAVVVATLLGGLVFQHRGRQREMALAASRPGPMQPAMLIGSATAPQQSGNGPARRDALGAKLASTRLVRTATLSIEVGAYAEAAEKAAAIAASREGFVADAKSSRDGGGRERGTLTLRVPADRFEEAVRDLKSLGRVEAASIATQDITREFADLEARLTAKRDAEARLREILQTRTAGLSDLVAAEQERARLIEEIERLEGERRYDERQVAYGTIAIEIREPAAFLRDGALTPLREALRDALPLLSGSLAALIYAAAAALPWVLVGLLIWRLRRRFTPRPVLHPAKN